MLVENSHSDREVFESVRDREDIFESIVEGVADLYPECEQLVPK